MSSDNYTITDSVQLSTYISATPGNTDRPQIGQNAESRSISHESHTLGSPPPPYLASSGDNPNETPPPYEKKDNYLFTALENFKSAVFSARFWTFLGIGLLSGGVFAGIVVLIILTGRNRG